MRTTLCSSDLRATCSPSRATKPACITSSRPCRGRLCRPHIAASIGTTAGWNSAASRSSPSQSASSFRLRGRPCRSPGRLARSRARSRPRRWRTRSRAWTPTRPSRLTSSRSCGHHCTSRNHMLQQRVSVVSSQRICFTMAYRCLAPRNGSTTERPSLASPHAFFRSTGRTNPSDDETLADMDLYR